MTLWTSFLKEFYRNERNMYKSCSNSGGLKRAAKIYKCRQNKIAKTEKKMSKPEKKTFTFTNPMHSTKYRKTMKKKRI